MRLIDLSINISSGITPLRSNSEFWSNGTIPWLKTEQLGEKYIFDTSEYISQKALEETNIKIFPKNTLSIAMYGEGKTRGNVSILKRAMTTNQACCNIELNTEKADPEYVYYFLKTQYENLRSLSSGIRKNLNSNDIKNFQIRLPDLPTQQSIASVLSALDQKIAINNQINAQLEQMAKTLYDYWFVQFDFPDENGKPYQSSGGEMVYNDTLKRHIPKGWEVGRIKDYCISTGGFAFKSTEWTNYGNPVIKIKNIKEDRTLDILDIDFIDLSNRKIDEKFKGVAGNIVIAMTGATIGKFAIVPKSDVDLYINQRVGYFNLGNEPLNRLPFLINSLNMDYFRDAIYALSTGAAQPNISNEQINNINLLLPNEILIQKFNQNLKSNYSLILNNQYENHQLTQLRDFLLPMLMNGQVSVLDVQAA